MARISYHFFSFFTFHFPEILHPLEKSLTSDKMSDYPVEAEAKLSSSSGQTWLHLGNSLTPVFWTIREKAGSETISWFQLWKIFIFLVFACMMYMENSLKFLLFIVLCLFYLCKSKLAMRTELPSLETQVWWSCFSGTFALVDFSRDKKNDIA